MKTRTTQLLQFAKYDDPDRERRLVALLESDPNTVADKPITVEFSGEKCLVTYTKQIWIDSDQFIDALKGES